MWNPGPLLNPLKNPPYKQTALLLVKNDSCLILFVLFCLGLLVEHVVCIQHACIFFKFLADSLIGRIGGWADISNVLLDQFIFLTGHPHIIKVKVVPSNSTCFDDPVPPKTSQFRRTPPNSTEFHLLCLCNFEHILIIFFHDAFTKH